jgi:hypothetical protein
MGDITKGYTWLNGVTVTPARLHQMVDDATINDGAVTAAKLAATLDLTSKTVTLADASITAAKLAASLDLSGKTSVILPGESINGRTAATALVNADEFLFYDSATPGIKKITRENLQQDLVPPRGIIQSVYAEDATYANISNSTNPEIVVSNTDTIPGSTIGYEVVTATITPKFSNSKLRITANTGSLASNTATIYVSMVSRDSGAAEAIAYGSATANNNTEIALVREVDANSTSATTFRLKIGRINNGSIFVNGSSAARIFGGILKHSLLIEEIRA